MLCTDASPVQPVLKESSPGRWRHYTGGMHRCTVGWTGAEETSSGHLTSSLVQRTANAPMPFLGPSVQPVPKGWLGFDSILHQTSWRRFFRLPPDAPMPMASDLPVLLIRRGPPVGAALRALLRLSSLSLFVITWTKKPENDHLNNHISPSVVLSFDHQNHSKWHQWCHVRYNLPLFGDWWQHNQSKHNLHKIDKFNNLIPIEINWKPLTLAWMFTTIQWWLGLPLKPWFPPLFLPRSCYFSLMTWFT